MDAHRTTPPANDPAPPARPILVVDADTARREGVVLALRAAGYRTLEAALGAVALAAIAALPIHALVLAQDLPDMDGLTVCRWLRATGEAALLIIVVANDDPALLDQQARAAGATAVLSTRDLPETLLRCLADGVAAPGIERAADR